MSHIDDVITICTLVISISTVINLIAVFYGKIKAPENKQNQRISALEKQIVDIESHTDRDFKKLTEIEKSSKVTQKTLLSILDHLISGNDIDLLKQTRRDLDSHLVER